MSISDTVTNISDAHLLVEARVTRCRNILRCHLTGKVGDLVVGQYYSVRLSRYFHEVEM